MIPDSGDIILQNCSTSRNISYILPKDQINLNPSNPPFENPWCIRWPWTSISRTLYCSFKYRRSKQYQMGKNGSLKPSQLGQYHDPQIPIKLTQSNPGLYNIYVYMVLKIIHCGEVKTISTDKTISGFQMFSRTSNRNHYRNLQRTLPTINFGLT